MFSFIHAADLHLDSPLRGLERYEGAPADEIRGATRRALENLVSLALERQVDFALIAGDLYDGDWKDHNTGLFFIRQMARLREADVPVIMISGNHDAANRMTKSLQLPDNVELLGYRQPTTAQCHRLEELGVAVHGQSFAKAAVLENLARAYPDATPGMFNIGLLHTSLQGYEGHEPYAPCTLDDLKQKGYQYWALGHVHQRTVVCEDPLVVFPGNTQGRHIRETGAKGCYVVTVDERHQCDLEFVPLDVFRWEICLLDASEVEDQEELLERFGQQLEELAQQHDGIPLAVRVQVEGATALHDAFLSDPVHWGNQFRAASQLATSGPVWIEKVRWQTTPRREPDEIDPASAIGVLMDYLREVRQDETQLRQLARSLDDLARKLPRELLTGPEALAFDDPEQIRQWMEEAEPLLLRRLRSGGNRP